MAISEVRFKANPQATPETWMKVTDTTAVAGDVASGKDFYGADGIKTTGTGSGGGGGTVEIELLPETTVTGTSSGGLYYAEFDYEVGTVPIPWTDYDVTVTFDGVDYDLTPLGDGYYNDIVLGENIEPRCQTLPFWVGLVWVVGQAYAFFETSGQHTIKATCKVPASGIVIVPEQSVTAIYEPEEGLSIGTVVPNMGIQLVAGKTYTVTLDGVEYTAVAIKNEYDNIAVGSTDVTFTDFPFYIDYQSNFAVPASGTYTVKVVENFTGGGGGSSDFSTATVTSINNTEEYMRCLVPYTIDAPEDDFYSSAGETFFDIGTMTTTAILYKGKSSIYLPSGGRTITISGDIEDDGGDYYIITGDCTITIS